MTDYLTPIEVLAQATSPKSGKTFPQVWIVKHPRSRVVCITLGLFTRAAALLLVIEFIFIVYSHLTMQGWNVANGAEFPFLWLVVYIVFLCRGGGPYSVDAKMSREL